MCGITGFIDSKRQTDRFELESIVARMADTLAHRGPDDHGVWSDPAAGVALGHRRLSILDLSPAGHQPMMSPNRRFVISFNGEIYNCEQIREQLVKADPGLRFRGHSDTEVILAAFEQWGVELALQQMNGMFAFALWDCYERVLFLARDRLGEKPLYYGSAGGVFLFGSELKAIREHPAFNAEIDRNSLVRYLQFNCVPAPYSIYNGIRKLLPGTILRYKDEAAQISTFWSLRTCVENGLTQPFRGSEAGALEELDHLLKDAVRLRMQADVPLGAFLSGGIDSSLIVALMQAQSERPVRTFTIGFEETGYDEAKDARAVARHLNTEHTELYVRPADAIGMVTHLPEVYDEPFADSSQLPTLLVSQLTRQHVTVSLSGDGGDEAFGGYNRYSWGGRLWNSTIRTPRLLRRLTASAITAVEAQHWESIFALLHPILPDSLRQRTPGYKLHRLAALLASRDQEDLYLRMASHWLPSERIVRDTFSRTSGEVKEDQWLRLSDFALQAMYLDSITYLPDDILTKVDRATMSFSLEGRIPYLDHRVVEFAWRLPMEMKVRSTSGKWILRQLLHRYVPPGLVERSKMGFGLPLDSWLRTSMRDWAEALLDAKRMEEQGFFNSSVVRGKWDDLLKGRGIWHYHLWDVLMFQSWLDKQSLEQRRAPRFATA